MLIVKFSPSIPFSLSPSFVSSLERDGAYISEIYSPGVEKFYISILLIQWKGRATFEKVAQFSHITVSDTKWLVSLGRL